MWLSQFTGLLEHNNSFAKKKHNNSTIVARTSLRDRRCPHIQSSVAFIGIPITILLHTYGNSKRMYFANLQLSFILNIEKKRITTFEPGCAATNWGWWCIAPELRNCSSSDLATFLSTAALSQSCTANIEATDDANGRKLSTKSKSWVAHFPRTPISLCRTVLWCHPGWRLEQGP